MNVWMTWCKKRTKCHYCPEPIEKGTPIVKCRTIKDSDGVKLTYFMYFHPKCWLENGYDYLRQNPYNPGLRGRKRLLLSKEDSEKRYRLLRQHSALRQRLRNITSKYPDYVLVEARIHARMAELMVQIASVGGIPPKWLE